MKLIKKIKKTNGKYSIYLLGIKVFCSKKNIVLSNGNSIEYNGRIVSSVSGLAIKFKGKNSKVKIEGNTIFENSYFELENNNIITIEASKHIIRLQAWCGDETKINIGKDFSSSNLQIHAGDGKNLLINIGNDVMCSWDVEIWASDGHTIYNKNTKKILNMPYSVTIGNHVWLCKSVAVLKNTNISNNCIVARNCVVSGPLPPHEYCILGGIPAKIIKKNVDWDRRKVIDYSKIF